MFLKYGLEDGVYITLVVANIDKYTYITGNVNCV